MILVRPLATVSVRTRFSNISSAVLKLLDKGYSMLETAEMVKNGVTAEWLAAADEDA